MRIALALAAMLLFLAVSVVLFAYSGLYNIAATSPHLPPVRWLMEVGMRRSVAFHARGIEPPPLTDAALVYRGFRHFEGVCVPCHGAPGVPRTPLGQEMLPLPPELSEKVPDWSAGELFWIVKHGIKMTGMPAWGPKQREDEIWAVVAFLLRLPQLGPDEYRALARLDARPFNGAPYEGGRLIALSGPVGDSPSACARCHGIDGAGGGAGAFPRLAGQTAAYLYEALRAYASDARPSGIMGPIARNLTDREMREVAAYYAAQDPPYPPPPVADATVLQLGGALVAAGAPDRGIRACRDCHGPSGIGNPPRYPSLAGQYADYIALQLHLWKEGRRGGGPDAQAMRDIAMAMTDAQIRAVSLYLASVRPAEILVPDAGEVQ